MKGAHFDFSTFDDCAFRDAHIDDTYFNAATFTKTDLREASIKSLHLNGANLEEAFSPFPLQNAIERINAGDSLGQYYFEELLRMYNLFEKATYDDKTIVSQAVRDAIELVAQGDHERH
jgi:uncharacterized protein YjbI with pentapeptide repeats